MGVMKTGVNTLKLRNHLRKAGFDGAARRITQTNREYSRAIQGRNNVPGGVMGACNRWLAAVRAGEALLSPESLAKCFD